MKEDIIPALADYELLDSGDFEKLERFGDFVTRRPEPQAVWRKSLSEEEWRGRADAVFRRDERDGRERSFERGEWHLKRDTPSRWWTCYDYKDMHLRMRIGLTSFKHVGIFPEQAANWNFIYDECLRIGGRRGTVPRVLNLFAYTGGATLAARAAGAETVHVDSVRQVVTWARENMEASGLDGVRWIVEDALKFVGREIRRGNRYNGIILDPPAYGRGADGEKWVLEENIGEMLDRCVGLLEPHDSFLVLNLYSMGLSPTVSHTLLRQKFGMSGEMQYGELCFEDSSSKRLPLGTYCRLKR